MRYFYYKRRLKFLGRNVKIDTGVYFQNPRFISISENCWIDKNVVILAGLDNSSREKILKRNNKYPGLPGEVFIGKNVHIGIGSIISGISSGVYISDDCGFSANCKDRLHQTLHSQDNTGDNPFGQDEALPKRVH